METQQNAKLHYVQGELSALAEVTRQEVAEWNTKVADFKTHPSYIGQNIPVARFKEHPAFKHLRSIARDILILTPEDALDTFIAENLSRIGKSETGEMLYKGKGEAGIRMSLKALEAKRALAYDRDDNAVILETSLLIEFYAHLHCILWYEEGLASDHPISVAIREAHYG